MANNNTSKIIFDLGNISEDVTESYEDAMKIEIPVTRSITNKKELIIFKASSDENTRSKLIINMSPLFTSYVEESLKKKPSRGLTVLYSLIKSSNNGVFPMAVDIRKGVLVNNADENSKTGYLILQSKQELKKFVLKMHKQLRELLEGYLKQRICETVEDLS